MELQPMLVDTKQRLIDRVRQHPFLGRCRQQTVTLDELKVFLVQQGMYSSYFTRYLCAMMGNLPRNDYVLKVASNLVEELGLAEDSPTQHSTMYREMLAHFGLSREGAKPLLGTRRLIDTMFDHCRDPKPARGLGALCLGAEMLVPAVYTDVIAGFQGCGVSSGAVAFFQQHVECDDGHADIMWEIMMELVKDDPGQVALMVNAGEALVDARLAFFTSIEASVGFAALRHADAPATLLSA
ncbi:iron-containing redox enzyme family protein [Arenibaculum sp.]|uniref:TenA family transcriptional regulator n=1 Tax=Arenibaculum sp. TaxID=2865862 RepID=UPI002E14E1A5|nr:iron-containing redox enzyme family protein [Arenibaculum sp.]